MGMLASALRCLRCGCSLPAGLFATLFCCLSRSCRGAEPILLRVGLLAAEMGGATSLSASAAAKLCVGSATGASPVSLFRAALAEALMSP